MTQIALTNGAGRPTKGDMRTMMTIALLSATGFAGGCVSVTAPDKPIVINLNIKITQDIVYRIDGKSKALIESNGGIF